MPQTPLNVPPGALVDSHCHLDFPELLTDIDAIVARARTAGVGLMTTICTRLRQEPDVRALAERFDEIVYAVGAHPLHLDEEPIPEVADLIAIAAHPKMVGIGETGLDYHYDSAPRDVQEDSFRRHIAAARETGLPLIVHTRDADADSARILSDEYAKGAYSCVLHCFTGGAELAQTALDMGFYLSMSGVATFKNASALREIFAAAPLDRILVETDSPYLAPVPKRGKRNEPAFTAFTAAVGAQSRGLSVTEFAQATTDNYHRLFTKSPRIAPIQEPAHG